MIRLFTGTSGHVGSALLDFFSSAQLSQSILWLNNSSSPFITSCHSVFYGDCSLYSEWSRFFTTHRPDEIVIISDLRHFLPCFSALLDLKDPLYKPKIYVVGTTGVFSKNARYSREYKLIEENMTAYHGELQLFRPSMIFGSVQDKNIHRVIRFISKYRFFVIFGSGRNLLQPVYFKDLAFAIYNAIFNHSYSGSFNLPGLYSVTYEMLVHEIFSLLNIRPRIIRLPISLVIFLLFIPEKILRIKLPVSIEQLNRLREDKVFSAFSSSRFLDYSPLGFHEALSIQIKSHDY